MPYNVHKTLSLGRAGIYRAGGTIPRHAVKKLDAATLVALQASGQVTSGKRVRTGT